MSHESRTRPALLFVSLVTSALFGACNIDFTGPHTPGLVVDFTADQQNPQTSSISLQNATFWQGDTADVFVQGANLEGASSLTYTLTWDDKLVRFVEGKDIDSFFPDGSSFTVTQLTPGSISVRQESRTPGSGYGILHSLRFRALTVGSTGLFFQTAEVWDASGTPLPISAYGGRFDAAIR